MLFFVIGLPGRFAEWCERATARLAQHACGAAEPINADTLEEITDGLLRGGAAHGVVASRRPGGRVRRALIEAGRPFIVVLDDPWSSLAHLVGGKGMAMAEATQLVASSCASVISFAAAPGALVLRADDGDPQSVAAAIAEHLQLDIRGGEIADLVRTIEPGGAIPDPGDAALWRDGLDPGERAIAGGALGPYLGHRPGAALGPIIWAAELFFAGDRPGVRATGGVDITGRARCLLRGPRIMLPPATWLLSVALEVSPDAAEHGIVVEATAGAVVGRTVIRPTGAGEVEAKLTLALEDLSDHPIDLILSNERPAFGGHLTLLRVTLTPQPPAPDMPAGAADGTGRVSDGSVAPG
jgi:hypothetical protein